MRRFVFVVLLALGSLAGLAMWSPATAQDLSLPRSFDGERCVVRIGDGDLGGLDQSRRNRCTRECRRLARACSIEACSFNGRAINISRQLERNCDEEAFEPEYTLAWSDEFSNLRLRITGNSRFWSDHWVNWNVRHLAGNLDEAMKINDRFRLPNGRTVRNMLVRDGRFGGPRNFLHEASGGTLKLRTYPLRERDRPAFYGYPYIASMISGERTFAQRYGYWEVRLRAKNVPRGHHFSLWLMDESGAYPPEIDILEIVGTNPARNTSNRQFGTNVHLSQGSLGFEIYTAPKGPAAWYVFGFEWTPDALIWTVDGREVRRERNLIGNHEMSLIASWEVGNDNWYGNPDSTTDWPGEVEIDYIRIYQR